MAPKFRGDSEDWLDEEESSGARPTGGPKRKPSKYDKAKPLPSESANAVVSAVFPKLSRVRMDEDGAELLCSYRRATVIRQSDEDPRERSPVAVGDRVLAERISPQDGIIVGVCLRRNHLSRPAPGRERKPEAGPAVKERRIQHVIAANIDDLVIVTSAKEPVFTPGLVDRYLVAAAVAGIMPVLVLNKIDLIDPDAPRPSRLYQDLGYEVFEVSSKKQIGVDALDQRLLGRSAVFCGQSGVGKTSLLRTLVRSEIGKIGEVSAATGKGKHTTTAAVLLAGFEGSQWIDTPGVREFGLAEADPEKLAGFFPEFSNLDCKAPGCLHLNEDGCQAKEFPRYSSYRRILESLLSGEN